MKAATVDIPGLLLIEPDRFPDDRGFLLETYRAERYRRLGIAEEFVQDNHSRSVAGVLRGLHFQVRRPQSQIVTVMRGAIFDVTVDLRPASAHFGRWYGVTLSEDGPRQLYMPPGFAHGFCVLTDVADLHYKVSRSYEPGDEGGLRWNDPDIGVPWPIENPLLSPRDADYPCLKDIPADRLPHIPSGD
jgi:dTDP-4-dehydrorhamnose 3,5-epimerase